jgi:hypothetical protein
MLFHPEYSFLTIAYFNHNGERTLSWARWSIPDIRINDVWYASKENAVYQNSLCFLLIKSNTKSKNFLLFNIFCNRIIFPKHDIIFYTAKLKMMSGRFDSVREYIKYSIWLYIFFAGMYKTIVVTGPSMWYFRSIV